MNRNPLLLLVVTAVALACAAARGEDKITWHDAAELSLEGQGWTDVLSRYDRLPARAKEKVRPEVWNLSMHSAGLSVRFITNATTIRARWTLRSERLEMNHMPATGVSGLDLYVKANSHWRFLAVARPSSFPVNEVNLVRGLTDAERELRLYFPLYNGVTKVEIGVPEGATLTAAPPPSPAKKPIVFYGTSITQGGCASRPGMAYSAILQRKLDCPIINLGFSGNGKTEPELAELLSELDASVFVMDSLPNLEAEDAVRRVPSFIARLRSAHPSTPIVLVENVLYTDAHSVALRATKTSDKNAFLKTLFEERSATDPMLFYVPAIDLLGDDDEATVDGTHPTDLGFLRMANVMEPILRRALSKASSR